MNIHTIDSASENHIMDHINADKVTTSIGRCPLKANVALSSYVVAEEGYCVAVRALEDKEIYGEVECIDGAFYPIRKGDVLVGALGEREAIKGYSGRIPRRVQPGDVLNILNMGGIIGQCTSDHPELGPALRVEVLGAVLIDEGGDWCHARIQDYALEPVYALEHSAPLVIVSGTSMNTGKTLAACSIVEGLTERGMRVAAAKLTGASLQRDVRAMHDNGAIACATFSDAGVVASTNKQMAPLAKGIISHLNEVKPDVIVLEMGDGFIGYYGVDELLLDKELQRHAAAHVVAATDLAGAWAADRIFRSRYRAPIAVMTGPVTDNDVGCRYIRNAFGIPACNARDEPASVVHHVALAIEASQTEKSGESFPYSVAV